MIIDRRYHTCETCGLGEYRETEFFDDMDGVLHCDKCGAEVKRHYEMSDTERLAVTVDLLKKIVGPWTYEDNINCLDDVMILARKVLDKIGETW